MHGFGSLTRRKDSKREEAASSAYRYKAALGVTAMSVQLPLVVAALIRVPV